MRYFITTFSSVMGIGLMLSVIYQNPLILGTYLFAAVVAGSLAELLGKLFEKAAGP
ncbi:hypothetical protein [Ignicoccus hospitalis]|uniref:Uncharacterized protein n=1 Tax=Ignicoccus hospitalis (strain KIN4/I / DSM 18386 / JCM 14125) TaxID=453591 RepID=A8AA90_IGNH4|nr:hypothetical protein [Ignicoccus hospitalis]ABU81842.1 hypothetical protein Igni_0660 [Ignicoccus hospitalis KIN4/I]HIH90110.1 hypothetical protein [Desulfurococcaceae archaeon]